MFTVLSYLQILSFFKTWSLKWLNGTYCESRKCEHTHQWTECNFYTSLIILHYKLYVRGACFTWYDLGHTKLENLQYPWEYVKNSTTKMTESHIMSNSVSKDSSVLFVSFWANITNKPSGLWCLNIDTDKKSSLGSWTIFNVPNRMCNKLFYLMNGHIVSLYTQVCTSPLIKDSSSTRRWQTSLPGNSL